MGTSSLLILDPVCGLFSSEVCLWHQANATNIGVLVITRLVFWLVNQYHQPFGCLSTTMSFPNRELVLQPYWAFSVAFVLNYCKVHFDTFCTSNPRGDTIYFIEIYQNIEHVCTKCFRFSLWCYAGVQVENWDKSHLSKKKTTWFHVSPEGFNLLILKILIF